MDLIGIALKGGFEALFAAFGNPFVSDAALDVILIAYAYELVAFVFADVE